MSINKISEPSVDEETKIEGIADDLYRRIEEETERLLKSQLQALGIYPDDFHSVSMLLKKTYYPDDELALASYEFNGQKILGVRIGESRMSIEFDVVNLKPETPKKGEVQDV